MNNTSISIALLILTVSQFIFIAYIIFLHNKILKYKLKIEELKTSNNKLDELFSIEVGSKGIIKNYGLVTLDDKKPFKVDYEVNILEIAGNQLKVSAYAYTSSYAIANDPSISGGILPLLQNKWVSKDSVIIIMDDSAKREIKLNKLGIKD